MDNLKANATRHILVQKTIRYSVASEVWENLNHAQIYQLVINIGKSLDRLEALLQGKSCAGVTAEIIETGTTTPTTAVKPKASKPEGTDIKILASGGHSQLGSTVRPFVRSVSHD